MLPIIFITLCLAAVIIFIIRKRLRSAKPENLEETSACEYTSEAVEMCRHIVCNTLTGLAKGSVTEVCRNHRIGTQRLNKLSQKMQLRDIRMEHNSLTIYLHYMIDSATKIAECSRNIATTLGHRLSISARCEIQTVCDIIDKTLKTDNTQRMLIDKIALNRDVLKQLIADRTETMCYEDFRDETEAYAHLVLLYHLHSLINSFCHIATEISSDKMGMHGEIEEDGLKKGERTDCHALPKLVENFQI